MTEKQFRNKTTFVTFFLSLLVVFIHSYNIDLYLGAGPYGTAPDRAAAFLEHFIGDVLGPVAVPGFFMMSAYLFYRNVSWNSLPDKMLRRVKSVLIPYIIWNFLYYMGYVCLRRIPALTAIVGEGEIPFSMPVLADAIINFTYNPVFWYLYQLIILIALAPVIYLVLRDRRLGAGALVLLAVAIACYAGIPWLNLDALFYYSAAAYVALHGRALAEWEAVRQRAAVIAAGFVLAVIFYLGSQRTYYVILTVLYRLTVPALLWLIIDGRKLGEPKAWMKNGFFLYAIHFIIARGLNKAGALMLPHTWMNAAALYVLIPALVTVFAWKLGDFLKKWLPSVWRGLSGGR